MPCNKSLGNSLVVLWLGIHVFTAGGPDLSLVEGLPQATWCCKKNKNKNKNPPYIGVSCWFCLWRTLTNAVCYEDRMKRCRHIGQSVACLHQNLEQNNYLITHQFSKQRQLGSSAMRPWPFRLPHSLFPTNLCHLVLSWYFLLSHHNHGIFSIFRSGQAPLELWNPCSRWGMGSVVLDSPLLALHLCWWVPPLMNLPASDPIIFSDSYCIKEEAYRTYHFFFLLCCIWSQRQNCVTLGKLHNLSEPYLSNDANETYP